MAKRSEVTVYAIGLQVERRSHPRFQRGGLRPPDADAGHGRPRVFHQGSIAVELGLPADCRRARKPIHDRLHVHEPQTRRRVAARHGHGRSRRRDRAHRGAATSHRRACGERTYRPRLHHRRRPRRSRTHHRARPPAPRRGRRRRLRPRRGGTLRWARPDAERLEVGRAGRTRGRAGRHLDAARRKGARRPHGRAVEMGRPVRLRQRREGSAVPARTGRPVRGRAGHPRRGRRDGVRRHPHHLPRRRRRGRAAARPRGRDDRAAGRRLGRDRRARRHDRLLRGRATRVADAGRARRPRRRARHAGGADPSRHAADAAHRHRHDRGAAAAC